MSRMQRSNTVLKIFARDKIRDIEDCKKMCSSDALGQTKLGFYCYSHKICKHK